MFNIMNDNCMPLLSLNTFTEMGLVTIDDSDTSVNTVSETPVASASPAPRSSMRNAVRAAVKEIVDLLTELKDVFEGLGELPEEYHIVTDESVTPVIHPPRRVPVPSREKIKEKLDDMVQRRIIKLVTECQACSLSSNRTYCEFVSIREF